MDLHFGGIPSLKFANGYMYICFGMYSVNNIKNVIKYILKKLVNFKRYKEFPSKVCSASYHASPFP